MGRNNPAHPLTADRASATLWVSGQAIAVLRDVLLVGVMYLFIRWGNPWGPTGGDVGLLLACLALWVLAFLAGRYVRQVTARAWALAAASGEASRSDRPGALLFVARTAALVTAFLVVADRDGAATPSGHSWGMYVLGALGGMLLVEVLARVAERGIAQSSPIDWVSALTYAAASVVLLVPAPGGARTVGVVLGVLMGLARLGRSLARTGLVGSSRLA